MKGGRLTQSHRRPDAYHTCYNLAGLSMTVYQHHCADDTDETVSNLLPWTTQHSDLFRSFAEEGDSTLREVRSIQPVYVIPQTAISKMQQWSRSRAGSNRPPNGNDV